MSEPPRRLDGSDMVRMAHAICDADSTLEDFKHGHRCLKTGCLVPHDVCVAWQQARAAIRAAGLVWRPAAGRRRYRPRPPRTD